MQANFPLSFSVLLPCSSSPVSCIVVRVGTRWQMKECANDQKFLILEGWDIASMIYCCESRLSQQLLAAKLPRPASMWQRVSAFNCSHRRFTLNPHTHPPTCVSAHDRSRTRTSMHPHGIKAAANSAVWIRHLNKKMLCLARHQPS